MTLVRYESQGFVATITMDRSSVHNALNNALCTELRQAWQRCFESGKPMAIICHAPWLLVSADRVRG